MAELTVVSLNLRGVHDRWFRREPLVVHGLAALDADVICLQEAATWCLQARWLAWRLSRRTGRRYRVCQARKQRWRGVFEGVATLSRLPIREHCKQRLDGRDGKVAQYVIIEAATERVCVANVHLDHHRNAGTTRRVQARALARWLELRDEPVVLVGDFNDVPESDCLRALEPGFRACHEAEALRGTAPAWERRRIVDYVLVTERVEAIATGTCLEEANDGVWPSDHIGLWARLRV